MPGMDIKKGKLVVRSHKRRGTGGVKQHTRSTPKRKRVPSSPRRVVDVEQMYQSMGYELDRLSKENRVLYDKFWNMRLQGALDGAEPVISIEMVGEQIDQKEREIKMVEDKISKIRMFRGQKLTIDQYKNLVKI